MKNAESRYIQDKVQQNMIAEFQKSQEYKNWLRRRAAPQELQRTLNRDPLVLAREFELTGGPSANTDDFEACEDIEVQSYYD